jgi:hypothetical protein
MAKTKTTSNTPFRAFAAKIRGITPYSQSRMVIDPKPKDETWDEYEARVWRLKMHTSSGPEAPDSVVTIPAASLTQCIAGFAKLKSERVAGKGMKTWAAPFLTGVRVFDDVRTDVLVAAVYSETNMCDSQGKKGGAGGSRVARTFPCIKQGWRAEPIFLIVDDSITVAKFTEYLTGAGYQIGIGRWRPQNGGSKGMFAVESVAEVDPVQAMGI